MFFSTYLEQKKKQLKDKWEAAKTRSELESVYTTTCNLLLEEQKTTHELRDELTSYSVRVNMLFEKFDNEQKEKEKYKKMYADELQKRLELAKLVEEMGDKTNE